MRSNLTQNQYPALLLSELPQWRHICLRFQDKEVKDAIVRELGNIPLQIRDKALTVPGTDADTAQESSKTGSFTLKLWWWAAENLSDR